IVRGIVPLDALERHHIDQALAWLADTDDIFRRIEPATPSPHLVVYAVLIDPDGRGVYLGRHLKSGLHLPTGGHVEPGEHPSTAARRETLEELGMTAEFTVVGQSPLFLTMIEVTDSVAHVDISLWYVIRGDRSRDYPLAPEEFDGGAWWDIDPYGLPDTDPNLGRFLVKLNSALERNIPSHSIE
ncbi:NUDIX domain-containing protein, partial [Nocardia gipuzkoensis]